MYNFRIRYKNSYFIIVSKCMFFYFLKFMKIFNIFFNVKSIAVNLI